MLIFPILVLLLNAVFASILFRQFVARKKPQQAAWAVSLTLGFAAALFYLLFLGFSHELFYFRLYYLAGGTLMAAYLGLGSIYLHAGRRIGDVFTLLLVVTSVLATGFLFSAPIDAAKLHAVIHSFGPGASAIGSGPWKAFTAVLNSFGAVAVIAGAVYSAIRTVRRQAPLQFLWANILIAVGTLIAAAAGVAADQGAFAGVFWAVLAVGFIVLFAGFILAGARRPAATGQPATDTPLRPHRSKPPRGCAGD